MNWEYQFDQVIRELNLHEHCKADAYYFYIEKKVQYLDLSIKTDIIIPCAVPWFGTYVGQLYILQIPGWEYIYHYLTKYSNTSSLLYPKEVNYDYIYAYKELVDSVKDKYDYLELYTVSHILYPVYIKWLSNHHSSRSIFGGHTCFPNEFEIRYENEYYEFILYIDLMNTVNQIKNSEYNDQMIQNYLIIKHKLPKYVNILSYLLLN